MNHEWKNRFFASALLVILFPIFIFFAYPSQPTKLDIILVLVGFISGFPLGVYMIRGVKFKEIHTNTAVTNEYIGIFVGVVVVSIIASSIWFGKQFMLTLIASILACFLVVMIFVMIYHWHNRPRT